MLRVLVELVFAVVGDLTEELDGEIVVLTELFSVVVLVVAMRYASFVELVKVRSGVYWRIPYRREGRG